MLRHNLYFLIFKKSVGQLKTTKQNAFCLSMDASAQGDWYCIFGFFFVAEWIAENPESLLGNTNISTQTWTHMLQWPQSRLRQQMPAGGPDTNHMYLTHICLSRSPPQLWSVRTQQAQIRVWHRHPRRRHQHSHQTIWVIRPGNLHSLRS